ADGAVPLVWFWMLCAVRVPVLLILIAPLAHSCFWGQRGLVRRSWPNHWQTFCLMMIAQWCASTGRNIRRITQLPVWLVPLLATSVMKKVASSQKLCDAVHIL